MYKKLQESKSDSVRIPEIIQISDENNSLILNFGSKLTGYCT